MPAEATLVMWFHLRSPELAEEFERLMASDRDIVHRSLDTMPDWRLTRPTDLPGQASEAADYVLIAEIVKLRDLERVTSIVVTHQIRDAFYIATHEAVRTDGRIDIVNTENTRAGSGICSPLRPSGYPDPSNISWCDRTMGMAGTSSGTRSKRSGRSSRSRNC